MLGSPLRLQDLFLPCDSLQIFFARSDSLQHSGAHGFLSNVTLYQFPVFAASFIFIYNADRALFFF